MSEKRLFSRENIDTILNIVPKEARCCYTGQSILAYCPDPTFDWEEVNSWPDETDVDIFCFNKPCLSSLVQAFIDAGFRPASEIDEFKAERIRFMDPPKKYMNSLQTVALCKEGLPCVNLTWHNESSNVVATIQRFDMDYLMVGMDLHTRAIVDLRGKDHRIANVNTLNVKFDMDDVDVMYWLRQFDRIPKGYSRGIDTRPVARQYINWLDEVIERGDRGVGSKTRFYAERKMETSIEVLVSKGMDPEMAQAIYHLIKGEEHTWDAMRIQFEKIKKTIEDWLKSVEND
jgi:hypothetical protein